MRRGRYTSITRIVPREDMTEESIIRAHLEAMAEQMRNPRGRDLLVWCSDSPPHSTPCARRVALTVEVARSDTST